MSFKIDICRCDAISNVLIVVTLFGLGLGNLLSYNRVSNLETKIQSHERRIDDLCIKMIDVIKESHEQKH